MIVEKISAETGLSQSQIRMIIRSSDHRYKTYTIDKRSGGKRIISQPSKKLKFVQRWLVRRVFDKMPVRLLSSLALERVCFGLCAFYYAAYLRVTHSLELAEIALPLVAFALGNITGTIFGGQIADRVKNRRLACAVILPFSGIAALALFIWHPSLGVTVGLGFAFGFLNALSRPSLMAALAEVPSEMRGTVMGLNSSVASVGWLAAALIGGWMYSGGGFSGFGPIMLALTIVAAILVLPERRREAPS